MDGWVWLGVLVAVLLFLGNAIIILIITIIDVTIDYIKRVFHRK